MQKKLLAEFIGTFVLCLGVILSVSVISPLPTPFLAGLILLLFVYSIGSISGCHINPGVTLGLLSLKKIDLSTAVQYTGVQLIAAFLAFMVVMWTGVTHAPVTAVPFQFYLFELLGMTVFTFGIASIVFSPEKSIVSGIVIGGSLVLGIMLSALGGAAGILNPAVALSLGTTAWGYYVVEIVGGILGFHIYSYLAHHSSKKIRS